MWSRGSDCVTDDVDKRVDGNVRDLLRILWCRTG